MSGILCETIRLKLTSNSEMLDRIGYVSGVEQILVANNNDFIPSLYDRIEYDGTLEEKVSFQMKGKLEEGYHYILALNESNEIVGFTEVKEGVSLVHNEDLRALNVGTSAIHKDLQGKGVAKMLYSFLDNLAIEFNVDVVVRRTWSTNIRQLKLYDKFGYEEIERIPNLRGEGIDSVRFCKWFKDK